MIQNMFPLLLAYSSWTIFALRIIFGIIMVAHGWPKLKNLKGTSEWFSSVGFHPGKFWAPLVALVEFFGGLVLIFGILVQPAAAVLAIQFLIICGWKISSKQKLVGGFELDLAILAGFLVILTVDTNINLLNIFYWL